MLRSPLRPLAFAVLVALTAASAAGCRTPPRDVRTRDIGASDVSSDAPSDAAADTIKPDVFVPLALSITVDELGATFDGSTPYTDEDGSSKRFRVLVPRAGFTVDVSWRGTRADGATLSIKADVALGDRAAGSELVDLFSRSDKDGRAQLRLPAERAAPDGAVTFTARIADLDGSQRDATVSFDVGELRPELDPFRLEDRWLVLFSQDLYTIRSERDSAGEWRVASEAKPNGVADFLEDLRAAGLGSENETAAAKAATRYGVTGASAIVAEWMKREILTNLRAAYGIAVDGARDADSVGIRFVREDEAGAPKLADYVYQKLDGSESTRGFSVIAIGGGDLAEPFLGRSRTVDRNNLQTEDNIGPGYGVFTSKALSTVAGLIAGDPTSKSLATVLLGDFIAALGAGGVAVGEHPHDGLLLDEAYDEKTAPPLAVVRARKLATVIQTLGRLVGALTAHEVGHALGLVAEHAPPFGLFGGAAKAEFTGPRTTPGHIDTDGFNIMEAGPSSAPGVSINIAQFLGAARFNPLNLAYLRRRLIVLPAPAP